MMKKVLISQLLAMPNWRNPLIHNELQAALNTFLVQGLLCFHGAEERGGS